MSRRLSRRVCSWGPALLLCALAIGSPAVANHSWGDAHWARTSTLHIRVGDSVGTAWDTHLREALKDWSVATELDMVVTTSSTAPSTCSPTYGIVVACSAKYGSTGWLGLGQIWTSGGHIVQGTAKVNNTYFSLAKYNTAAWRRSVMCQELGHTLGLGHQDEDTANANLGSCMDYTSDPTGTKGTNGTLNNTRPNAHDYQQLSAIYNHLDSSQLSSTTLSGSTSAAPAGERQRLRGGIGATRSAWGRAVAADKRGRPRVFVRDLGGDVQLTTFVIWADEATSEQTGEHHH